MFSLSSSDHGARIGALPVESYLYDEAEPGEHTLCVGLLKQGTTRLDVRSGHVYYLRCEPAAKVLYTRPGIALVPVVEGAAAIHALRPEIAAR